MISKKSFETIAEALAVYRFDQYCKTLDKKIEQAMNGAFEGERISQTRAQRIVNRFISKLGVS